MKKISTMAVAALIAVSAVSSSHAIGGVGFHWGVDLSLSMDDVRDEGIGVSIPGTPAFDGLDMFRVSRVDWGRTAINFGGKAYIDIIPFIDALEISCNFGLWQYSGSMEYITNPLDVALGSAAPIYSDPIILGLKEQGLKYIGLDDTPYAKLHFDLTVKKMLLNLWLVKFSGGAGVSAHFATPLLSGKLVEEAIGGMDLGDYAASGQLPSGVGKAIVQQIIDEALGKPVFGAHLVLGARAKLPIMPLGFYVDGKFMIPFNSYDKDVSKDNGIKGFGFLINTGVSLSI